MSSRTSNPKPAVVSFALFFAGSWVVYKSGIQESDVWWSVIILTFGWLLMLLAIILSGRYLYKEFKEILRRK